MRAGQHHGDGGRDGKHDPHRDDLAQARQKLLGNGMLASAYYEVAYERGQETRTVTTPEPSFRISVKFSARQPRTAVVTIEAPQAPRM